MHCQIYTLLTTFILCSAKYGELINRDGQLVCPSSPHNVVFTETTHGGWRSTRTDPNYPNTIFRYNSRSFFTAQDETKVIVTLDTHKVNAVIRNAYDPLAHQYAVSADISLKTFGEKMLYFSRQTTDQQCGLHSLRNLFQKNWIDPDKALEISRKTFPGTAAKIYPRMNENLEERGRCSFGHTSSVLVGALHDQGLMVDFEGARAFPEAGGLGIGRHNYFRDPMDTIFGIILCYNSRPFGHFMAVRRIGGVWWNLNSAFRKSPTLCGGTGNWDECRDFIRTKQSQEPFKGTADREALVVRCPTPDDISTYAMSVTIMPNLELWEPHCPNIRELIEQACFVLYHVIHEPEYARIVGRCPDCTEADCQKIIDYVDRDIDPGKYHCRTDTHQCEKYESYMVAPYGACDTADNRCSPKFADCIDEPHWEGTLGKCGCGTRIGTCNDRNNFDDKSICLLTMPHQCAPCTDGHDGPTNGGRDNCFGKVCRTNVAGVAVPIRDRECVERAAGHIQYDDEYKYESDQVTDMDIWYWFLVLDISVFAVFCCLVIFISFIGGCLYVLYFWKENKNESDVSVV